MLSYVGNLFDWVCYAALPVYLIYLSLAAPTPKGTDARVFTRNCRRYFDQAPACRWRQAVFDHGLDEAAEPLLHTSIEMRVKRFGFKTWKRMAVQTGGSAISMIKALQAQGVMLNPSLQDKQAVSSSVETATVRFGTVLILATMLIMVISRRWFFLACSGTC